MSHNESHFEDIEPVRYIKDHKWKIERCLHPNHNPPSHLSIPQGKRYVHVCPKCKATCVIENPITYSLNRDKNLNYP